jgi:NADPH2:quinone reductase
MKAIRVHQYGGPEVLQFEEVPIPQITANQILVRVHAVGVNPVETYIRGGAYAGAPGVASGLPFTPGRDAAGVIEKLGAAVTGWKAGDKVYTSNTSTGAYAEYCVCELEDIHPLSKKLSFAQGSGISTPYATAYRALFQRAKAQAGETVLIHGASGGVGTAATQIGRAMGLKVFGTAGTEQGSQLVKENGAHHVLDHHDAGYLAKAIELNGGRGFDVIIEMLANVNLAKDLTILAKGGRVVVVGNRGPVEINARDAMQRDAAILGMILFNSTVEERKIIYAALDAGFDNGTLRPVIGKEFSLGEAAKAHIAVMQSGAYGKIVLTV